MNNEITIDGVVYVRKDACSCPFMNKGNENTNKKYDFYNKVLNDIVVMNPLIRTYEFKPFNMCITIEAC